MKKLLCLCMAMLMLSTLLTGCNSQGPGSETTPAGTTTGREPPDVPGGTSSADTTEVVHGDPVAYKSVSALEMGLRAHTASSNAPAIVEATADTNGRLRLTAYLDGQATISVADCFGHKTTVDVSVAGETVTITPHKTEDVFIEASMQFGAKGDGTTDATAAIQAALDSAKPGETVYLYPGIYVVDLLCMPEGVTLEMYTTMTDATVGFTDELARQVKRGEITVLSGARIMNNKHQTRGAEGSSNFTVRGGVLDMCGTTKGAIIFACADGALLENVILKDVKNNHAIQYTGCTNSAIRNCMFAGYVWGGTFTREVVQIETSAPGATGTADTAPLQFAEGEFNYSENIEISHCYFGKSDELGVPLMAIGHHSQAGGATVTGFKITDNVFDGMLYAAIRYNGIVETEISGNTFTAYKKYANVKDESATTPAFIVLYTTNATTRYTSIVTGQKVTHAAEYEQAGIHGMTISGNTFNIPEGSDKQVVYISGNSNNLPGLRPVSGVTRQDAFNTKSYSYSGYTVVSNYMERIRFTDNVINVEGQPDYKDYLMLFQHIYGLEISGNKLNLAPGVSFTRSTDGIPGLFTRRCTAGFGPEQYTLVAETGRKIILADALGGEVAQLVPRAALNVIVNIEGRGALRFETRRDGTAIAIPVAAEGYVADGWYAAGSSIAGGELKLTSGASLTFRFIPKN